MFVFCVSDRGILRSLSLPPSGVIALSLSFSFCFRFSLLFGLRLAFVYCSGVLCLLPCSGISFYCHSLPLRLSSGSLSSLSLSSGRFPYCFNSPVFNWSLSSTLMSLSSHLEFVYFLFCLLTSFLHLFSLCCLYFGSPGVYFLFFLCCWLRSVLSSLFPLLPFFRSGGSSLRLFRVSGFT